jgi:hypothetical protein
MRHQIFERKPGDYRPIKDGYRDTTGRNADISGGRGEALEILY